MVKILYFQPIKTSEEIPIILRKLRFDSKIKKNSIEKLIAKKDINRKGNRRSR